jgi:hypothetical protein
LGGASNSWPLAGGAWLSRRDAHLALCRQCVRSRRQESDELVLSRRRHAEVLRMTCPSEEAASVSSRVCLIDPAQRYPAEYQHEPRSWRSDMIAIPLAGRGRLTDVPHHRSAIALEEE